MAVGGTAVIAALTAAGEGDHSRQQQRDGCPDDPWILEQSTHGGERAAGPRPRPPGRGRTAGPDRADRRALPPPDHARRAARERADELLTDFGLTDAAERRVGKYSGGMRRRIDIACGLVTRPEVVFLDEPTTGLDPRSRQDVWRLVSALRDQGVTILLTTQYLEEADSLSDRIVVIDKGRVIASGTAAELKAATGASHYRVTPNVAEELEPLLACLGDLGATHASTQSDDATVNEADSISVSVPAPEGADTLVEIVRRTTLAGIRLSDITLRRPSLDEVFLALTGPDATSDNDLHEEHPSDRSASA